MDGVVVLRSCVLGKGGGGGVLKRLPEVIYTKISHIIYNFELELRHVIVINGRRPLSVSVDLCACTWLWAVFAASALSSVSCRWV